MLARNKDDKLVGQALYILRREPRGLRRPEHDSGVRLWRLCPRVGTEEVDKLEEQHAAHSRLLVERHCVEFSLGGRGAPPKCQPLVVLLAFLISDHGLALTP